MTKYQRDRTRIWIVGVRNSRTEVWCPTSIKWFHTRKDCQDYINDFREEMAFLYTNMEHKPLCYFPRDTK